jgi:hypothetical protein
MPCQWTRMTSPAAAPDVAAHGLTARLRANRANARRKATESTVGRGWSMVGSRREGGNHTRLDAL